MHSHIHMFVCDKGKELKLKVNPSPFRPGEEAAGKRYVSAGDWKVWGFPNGTPDSSCLPFLYSSEASGNMFTRMKCWIGGMLPGLHSFKQGRFFPMDSSHTAPCHGPLLPLIWTHCVIHASAHIWLHRWPYTSWKGEPYGSWGVSQPSGVLKA